MQSSVGDSVSRLRRFPCIQIIKMPARAYARPYRPGRKPLRKQGDEQSPWASSKAGLCGRPASGRRRVQDALRSRSGLVGRPTRGNGSGQSRLAC
jgi:hypothetical protein